ncbi:MAG: response regulator [Saprospiraceae bacterium]|nr:response regulator [Saprospiraceae bacterium]
MTRILVIDEEADMRQAYKSVLEKLDCQVDMAIDGLEGLDCFMNKIYDVVITEFNLDKIDGLQMLEHFQQIDAKVPVIFSSGLADETVIDEVMASGATDFLQKPANLDLLLGSISKAIYCKPHKSSDKNNEAMPGASR